MSAEMVEIAGYQYYQFAARDDLKTVMICIVKNSDSRVYVYFDGGSNPLQETTKSGPNYFLHYRYADFPVILDMLRNEKPVYLVYMPEGANNSRLSTSYEPVGEGEQS